MTKSTPERLAYLAAYRKGVRRPRKVTPVAVRLAARLDRVYGPVPEHAPELGPCWEWQGARNIRGYGVIKVDGELVLTHRLALSLALGRQLKPGMFANHKCDNKPCSRPSHLYEGTPEENAHDYQERRAPKPLPAKALEGIAS